MPCVLFNLYQIKLKQREKYIYFLFIVLLSQHLHSSEPTVAGDPLVAARQMHHLLANAMICSCKAKTDKKLKTLRPPYRAREKPVMSKWPCKSMQDL